MTVDARFRANAEPIRPAFQFVVAGFVEGVGDTKRGAESEGRSRHLALPALPHQGPPHRIRLTGAAGLGQTLRSDGVHCDKSGQRGESHRVLAVEKPVMRRRVGQLHLLGATRVTNQHNEREQRISNVGHDVHPYAHAADRACPTESEYFQQAGMRGV